MTGMGERAYAYARACGIAGKSFVGRRTAALRPLSRLSELDRLIFGPAARELPERELLADLERRLARRSAAAILSVIGAYKKPPEPLLLLLRAYEYADLKNALAAAGTGAAGSGTKAGAAAGTETEAAAGSRPVFTDLGRFGTVRFAAWPDLGAMLEGGEFEFLLEKEKNRPPRLRGESGGVSLETALDRRYYRELWKGIARLRRGDRRAAELITAEEIALRNCAWVLRLRTYYGMGAEEAAAHLITIDGAPALTEDAAAALEFPLDNREPWTGWKRIRFLNDESGGSWRASPRYFQNAAAEYLYRLSLRHFHRRPSSLDSVFCFIKLKQFEEDLLTSAAEGLGMGLGGTEVLAMLERTL
ncbi:MAG: V-type ATPase subunit [Treponema sp.]|jgi:hypothetical protein|nr:V-type ATPase subunit [Treponema sp.]